MKKIDELNGVKVKAKIGGEEVDCVLSIASAIQPQSGSLLFCQDKIAAGMTPDNKAKYYGKKYACGMNEVDEFIDEELGIFIYNNAPARKVDVKEANYVYLNNSEVNFCKLQKVWGYFYCKNADSISLPELKIVGEGAAARNVGVLRLPKVEDIYFFGCEDASLDMPKLKNLSCDIMHNTTICAPNLVRADVLTCNNKELNLPNLEEVGVILQANEAKTVYLPKLKNVGVGHCHDIQFLKAKSIYMPQLETKNNVRVLAFEAQDINIGPDAKCKVFVYAGNMKKQLAGARLRLDSEKRWTVIYEKDSRVIISVFKWSLEDGVVAQLTSKRAKYKILLNYETGKLFYAVPDGDGWSYYKDSFELRGALKKKEDKANAFLS